MSSDSDLNLPQLVQALDQVARWREAQEATSRARLDDIASERQRLEADIEDLQRQIQTLADLAGQVDAELAELPVQETQRTRAAVDAGIDAEVAVVTQRDRLFGLALKAREDHVAELLAQPDVARLVEEYEQFQEAEPTLGMLPEGYRNAILAHNENVKERLRPVMEAAQAPLHVDSGEADAITVVASLNPETGPAEALAVLLPVPYAVHDEWGDRPEDLASLLAFRVVGAIGATLNALGAPDAPVQFADYRGNLAIQVWLGDEETEGDLKEIFVAQIDRMREEAAELAAVGLELYTAWLDPEVVTAQDVGDDEDDEDEDETTIGGVTTQVVDDDSDDDSFAGLEA